MDQFYIDYIILPILIFVARIADVGIGTIRIIFVNIGQKKIAPILGFFEVLIWIVVIGRLMSNASNFWLYVAYALGFATGTYVGIIIEEKLSVGKVMISIILKNHSRKLINNLRNAGYPITDSNARSEIEKKNVKVIFSVIRKSKIDDFLRIVRETNPLAFYSIQNVRSARADKGLIGPKGFLGSVRKI
jgi:uncharacterized protein YebE (UPF0316 family)